ncbi:MAG: alkaline phosphatase family protein [Mariniblastus sp.]|nr:alkaline phosphatase family protein [Mariniblastus sp.]
MNGFESRCAALLFSCALFGFPSDRSVAQETASTEVKPVASIEAVPSRIAFGSCSNQNKPQPILKAVVAQRPDLFIYLGDNIYGDTKDMNVLAAKYAQLGAKREFQQLRAQVPVLSVWDDHDYGWNDAGKEYEFKEESKQIFMDFWKVPQDSPRRKHAGIYGSHRFAQGDKTLQIILLDTRTFRDPLKRNNRTNNAEKKFKNDYQPDASDKTLLGESQWEWLAGVLREPADLRIIASSIQFGHEYNGWESWTNLPNEQQRMVDLIQQTGAEGVLFISGDVHWGEISRRDFPGLYPIYDVTASGITEDWHNVEPNEFRIGEAFRSNHFGMLDVDWSAERPVVTMSIVDVNGKKQNTHTFDFGKSAGN